MKVGLRPRTAPYIYLRKRLYNKFYSNSPRGQKVRKRYREGEIYKANQNNYREKQKAQVQALFDSSVQISPPHPIYQQALEQGISSTSVHESILQRIMTGGEGVSLGKVIIEELMKVGIIPHTAPYFYLRKKLYDTFYNKSPHGNKVRKRYRRSEIYKTYQKNYREKQKQKH